MLEAEQYSNMATTEVISEAAQEGSSNTYIIRPNFQHKYVALLS